MVWWEGRGLREGVSSDKVRCVVAVEVQTLVPRLDRAYAEYFNIKGGLGTP